MVNKRNASLMIGLIVSASFAVDSASGQFRQGQEKKRISKDLVIGSEFADRDRKTKKVLEKSFSASYNEIRFSEIVKQISKKYVVNIVIDRTVIEDGLDLESRMSFAIKDVSLQRGLQLILSQHNATFFVDDGIRPHHIKRGSR